MTASSQLHFSVQLEVSITPLKTPILITKFEYHESRPLALSRPVKSSTWQCNTPLPHHNLRCYITPLITQSKNTLSYLHHTRISATTWQHSHWERSTPESHHSRIAQNSMSTASLHLSHSLKHMTSQKIPTSNDGRSDKIDNATRKVQ